MSQNRYFVQIININIKKKSSSGKSLKYISEVFPLTFFSPFFINLEFFFIFFYILIVKFYLLLVLSYLNKHIFEWLKRFKISLLPTTHFEKIMPFEKLFQSELNLGGYHHTLKKKFKTG